MTSSNEIQRFMSDFLISIMFIRKQICVLRSDNQLNEIIAPEGKIKYGFCLDFVVCLEDNAGRTTHQ